MDKRLLVVSIALHVLGILCIGFFSNDSRIHKMFLAYGRHSKRVSNAYFRTMRAPKSNYQKYLKQRNLRYKSTKRRVRKKKTVKVAKNTPKKVVKKKTVKKKPVKKPVKKKPIKKTKPKKTPVKNKKQPKKEKQEQKKRPKSKEQKKLKQEEITDSEPEEEFLHFNLLGESDPRMIVFQLAIQKEVDRVWRPPLGVTKGTECLVSFAISRDGSVKSFKIEKPSKMLIYDLSIVRVAKNFKFEKCLWGKSFEVNFRQ